jgi:site-specific DNA-methyltransferase (adenine-specific)
VRGGACHWTAQGPGGQPHIPTFERWPKLEALLGPAPDWMQALIRPAHELGSESREASEEAKKWTGWGTALKPSSEHWILVQKPISEHNIAANIRKWQTGGINIDESRIPVKERIPSTSNLSFKGGGFLWNGTERSESSTYHQHPKGRFPANLIVTRSNDRDCPAKTMVEQSESEADVADYFKNFKPETLYFYAKKAGKHERGEGNSHPTVKPLRLIRYLTKMVTPKGGLVLDPFMGSGTTGVGCLFDGFQFFGIESDEDYFYIAQKRLKGVKHE